MKIIKQACSEFCEKLNSVYDEKEVFKAGVEFAQQWIDIDDELPEIDEDVLIKTKNNKYKVASMYIPKDCYGNILGEKSWKGSTTFVESITHWRYINLK